MNDENYDLLTLGHSDRSREEFLSLLTNHTIKKVIDVRSYPNSRRFPHFCKGNLEEYLEDAGVGYEHWAELGGYRDPQPDSPNTALSEGFQAVADHLNSEAGQRALDCLQERIDRAGDSTITLMCAEKNYRECHRKLISDHLTVRGIKVRHLIDDSKSAGHELHQHARQEDTLVRYPGLV